MKQKTNHFPFRRIGFVFLLSLLVSLTLTLPAWGEREGKAAFPPSRRAAGATITATKSSLPTAVVSPGATITYTIRFTTSTLGTVVVTDTLPSLLSVVPSSITGTGSLQPPPGNGFPGGTLIPPSRLVWRIPNVSPHRPVTLTFRAVVSQTAQDGEIITNRAEISGTTATTTVSSTITVVRANTFSLTKTAVPPSGSRVYRGDTIVYTLFVTNTGQVAKGITLTDALPSPLQFITRTFSVGEIIAGGNVITWSIASLKGGGTVSATLRVQIPTSVAQETTFTNTFTANAIDKTSNSVTHRLVLTEEVYLPLVLKVFPPPLPTFNNPGFEAGPDGQWDEYSKQFGKSPGVLIYPGNKLPGSVRPHSGQYAAWLGGADDEISRLSQSVTIPMGYSSLKVSYWYWTASEETICSTNNDVSGLEVNGQRVITHILCSNENTNGWQKKIVDISTYQNGVFTFTFVATLNGTLNSNFFIDDVSFEQ